MRSKTHEAESSTPSASRSSATDARAYARGCHHQTTIQPLVTFAVAGGQNVLDAFRYHAA
jgi:hypothetical protein